MPGLIDSHFHAYGASLSLLEIWGVDGDDRGRVAWARLGW
jgi:predicted amidohydrolase YtcJ